MNANLNVKFKYKFTFKYKFKYKFKFEFKGSPKSVMISMFGSSLTARPWGKMTHNFRICVLVAISLLWPVTAPAACQVMFIPRISIVPEYSDNLFLTNENSAYDHITVISPGFTAQILEKTRGATLSYDLGYSSYDSFPQFNTLRHDGTLSGWIGFTKHTRLDFQERFLLTEESVTRLEEDGADEDSPLAQQREHVAEKETVRKTREYHYTNDVTVALTHQFGESDLFSFKYVNGILENEAPTVEDRRTHNPSVSVTYWPVPDKLGLEGGLIYTRDEFSATPSERAYWEERLNPSAGFSYWFVPHEFGMTANLSHSSGEFLGKADRRKHWYESTRPSMGLSCLYEPYQLSIEGDISHTIGSFSDPSDDFDNWNGSLSLTKKFTRQIEGVIRYSHTIMDFKGSGEDYTLHVPSIGINTTLAEGVPLSLSVGYLLRERQRNDSEAALSVNANLGKTWDVSRYGSVTFDTSSGYDEDYLGAEKLGFGVHYDAGFTAKYLFYKELTGELNGAYKKNKYVDLDITRNDETKEVGAALIFETRWFTIRVDYSHRSLDSTLSENDYVENRIRWQVMLAPLRPIKLFQ